MALNDPLGGPSLVGPSNSFTPKRIISFQNRRRKTFQNNTPVQSQPIKSTPSTTAQPIVNTSQGSSLIQGPVQPKTSVLPIQGPQIHPEVNPAVNPAVNTGPSPAIQAKLTERPVSNIDLTTKTIQPTNYTGSMNNAVQSSMTVEPNSGRDNSVVNVGPSKDLQPDQSYGEGGNKVGYLENGQYVQRDQNPSERVQGIQSSIQGFIKNKGYAPPTLIKQLKESYKKAFPDMSDEQIANLTSYK